MSEDLYFSDIGSYTYVKNSLPISVGMVTVLDTELHPELPLSYGVVIKGRRK